jgi:hypothetical protein
MAIKELANITPVKALGGDEDFIRNHRLSEVEALNLKWSLKVSFHCGANADEAFDDPNTMTNIEKTKFKNNAATAFAAAILNCTTQDFNLRLFKYDPDHPGALSTISYLIPLTAEQILALHDGAAQYDVTDIYSPEKWLKASRISRYAWISDEPCKTQLIKGDSVEC